jgi:hypothetical protein
MHSPSSSRGSSDPGTPSSAAGPAALLRQQLPLLPEAAGACSGPAGPRAVPLLALPPARSPATAAAAGADVVGSPLGGSSSSRRRGGGPAVDRLDQTPRSAGAAGKSAAGPSLDSSRKAVSAAGADSRLDQTPGEAADVAAAAAARASPTRRHLDF